MNKKRAAIISISIGAGVILIVLCVRFFLPVLAVGGLILDSLSTKVEVYENAEQYQDYIGEESKDKFYFEGERAAVFPKQITDNMKVEDFKFVYYNPWDAQYVTYLTVTYTEEDYQKELERLSLSGIDEYTGIYSVKGPPEGYLLRAMHTDTYEGFVYAMTPIEENHTITYVGIIFCNYFLDLDIHDYMPDQYLLKGFDATRENPYELEMRQGGK